MVFRDACSQRGVDFRDQVGNAIGSCAVLLAVIGPKWLRVQDESGSRRIDHPGDLVALEIAAALSAVFPSSRYASREHGCRAKPICPSI